MRDLRNVWVVIGVACLCSVWTAAQNQAPEKTQVGPYAAIGADDSTSKPDRDAADTIVPDASPVTGIQALSLGHSSRTRSFLQPSLSFSESFDTNPGYFNNQQNLEYTSTVGWGLGLERRREHQQLRLNYGGGASFYKENSGLNSHFHHLSIDNVFSVRRWSISLNDSLQYTPESPFGFAGLANIPDVQDGLRSTLLPSQSILTEPNDRLSNSAAAQIEYRLGPRSSVTASASYSALRFLGGVGLNTTQGLIDSNQWSVGTGYNQTLSARDTFGVQYSFMRYSFLQQPTGSDVHNFTLVYAHRIAGRMTLEAHGGPELLQMGGLSTLGAAAVGLKPNSLMYTAGGSVLYHHRNNDLQFSVDHSVTGGSGVLQGANTTVFQGSISRQIRRSWHASLSGGYSKNQALNSSLQDYNSAFGGGRISRSVSRSANAFLSYNVQQQGATFLGCTGFTCGDRLRHVITIGFDWHAQPIPIE
jgi:hypothetical protein